MGLFRKTRPVAQKEADQPSVAVVYFNESGSIDDGEISFNIVGEGRRQREILSHMGYSDNRYPIYEDVTVALVPEPSNPYDHNAVQVFISHNGNPAVQAGYLGRDDAKHWQPMFLDLHQRTQGAVLVVNGIVRGGGVAPDGQYKNVGVFVTVPANPFMAWMYRQGRTE